MLEKVYYLCERAVVLAGIIWEMIVVWLNSLGYRAIIVLFLIVPVAVVVVFGLSVFMEKLGIKQKRSSR